MSAKLDKQSEILDCLIIGGGAAGLTAATYFARFLRNVMLIDGGNSRLRWIPRSHNYPGEPEGIRGPDALEHMQQQAAAYDVPMTKAHVRQLHRQQDGTFLAMLDNGQSLSARTALLSTGVVDIGPDFPDAQKALLDGVLRYCPICDGYEARNKKTVVMGIGKGGLGEALFVRHYTGRLTLLTLGKPLNLTSFEQEKLRHSEITVFHDPVRDMRYQKSDRVITVELENGHIESFEAMYVALGTKVNSELAEQVGARLSQDGQVEVDSHMQTSIPGLYAAGDIVVGLNQIAVAMGHAAIAATAIHNHLNA